MDVQVHTFGCKVNTYDSGLMQRNLVNAGFGLAPAAGAPAVHVLNTCAVTAEATQQAVREIRRIKAKEPLATIVVTGCSAQVDTGAFDRLPAVDLVVANSHKGLLPELINQHFKGELKEKVFKSNIFRKDDLEMGGGLEEAHSRAFLKIQDGCNSFCSFCIIPYARGKSRSIPVAELVRRVRELHGQGLDEVVLTGVHIGDYEDGARRLEDLVAELLAKTAVPRFRLTSLEPVELTPRLLELFAEPRLCPHFHLSIQSANTRVLHAMKRKYGQAEVLDACARIAERLPQAFVGMDVIAGFPGETEEEFEDTYRALAEASWNRIHVFPYSERKGTRAEIMEGAVPWADRKRRAAKLRELSLARYQATALRQVGSTKQGLPLLKTGRADGTLTFLTRDYWNVEVENVPARPDREQRLRITRYDATASPKRPEGTLWGIYEHA